MLVLPLGLGSRLRRLPLATLAIASVWVGVFLLDHSDDRIMNGVLDAVAQSGVRDASRDLFVQYCLSRHGDLRQCRNYAVLVWTGFPAKALPAAGHRTRPAMSAAVDLTAMNDEAKRAEKLRQDLGDCGHSRACFNYKDIIWRFLDGHQRRPTAFAGLQGYAVYKTSVDHYRSALRRLCRTNLCLVKGNITLSALVAAQIRHGGFVHLASNLFFFLVFGAYVEQRTSRWLYALITIAGGTLGMAVHTFFFGSTDTIALGGSANVSTVMGLFYVFYLHSRMRFHVILPIGWRSFYADVRWCIPLMFVLSDLSGGFDNGFKELATENVAHFAHLTGMLCGLAAAWVIVRWRPLAAPLIYEAEVGDLAALTAEPQLVPALARAEAMLKVNPENVPVMEQVCTRIVAWLGAGPGAAEAGLVRWARSLLAANLQTVCAIHSRKGSGGSARRLLAAVPLFIPFAACLGRLGQVSTLTLADEAAQDGQALLALRLYDFFLSRFTLSVKCREVEHTAAGLIERLPSTPAHVEALRGFLTHHPQSQLAARIGAWLSNVQTRQA